VGDLAELVRLAGETRQRLADQRGGARWMATYPGDEPALSGAIEAGLALLALIDEVPIGYLVMSVESRVATVTEVYVMPEARELGFGETLLATATAIAVERHCEWIEGLALPGDRETKNLYERAGITARLIVVSRRL
jgi:GNAT superfamily N-acetyltransferase